MGGGKERDVSVMNNFQVFSLSQELFAKRESLELDWILEGRFGCPFCL